MRSSVLIAGFRRVVLRRSDFTFDVDSPKDSRNFSIVGQQKSVGASPIEWWEEHRLQELQRVKSLST